jgi:tRNA(Leu) C34 or U34 (ribose-2'-O)-methylase TrmL
MSKRGYAAIALDRPKDAANLGGVLRAAGCYSADLVMLIGDRMRGSGKTDTQKAWRHIPVIEADDLVIPYGATAVCVELIAGATPLQRFVHPEQAVYVFGPEDGSVSSKIAARCAHKVYVPTAFCMNLAATANVVLYDRMSKTAPAKNTAQRAESA